ncbi:Fc.00g100930.m01.CDS01 [Cosmosporella sp. VM-42]
MVRSLRTKVKTGCATCRIRKVKCDENKPFCQRCVNTGRTCDGYESPFRSFTSRPVNHAHAGGIKAAVGLQPIRPSSNEIVLQDIDRLNRYFSTKTIFDVKLGCGEEARQILQASLSDPPIRHAVLSLRALREDLETSGDGPVLVAQQTPSYNYGLQRYSMALRGLASKLSSAGSDGLKSALLCCQVFISIEQVRGNFAAMALHIIRGLSIMHEYRARPYVVAADKLVPAHYGQLPFLDVFLIKLFAAPCKFAEPSATGDVSGTTSSVCLSSPHQQPIEPRDLRTIAPNMRTELVRIAASTLKFLAKVSQVESIGNALRLISEKGALLNSLESWLSDLELVQTEIGPSDAEPLSVSFMRFFHLILKIVLLGALESSSDLNAELRTEHDRLQGVANNGHTAVALVRTSGSLTPCPGLTVVTGSPLSKDNIRSALSAAPGLSPSAAIITLNTVRKSDSPFAAPLSPPRFLADSCANVCEVLEQAGIHRVVVMSTAGVGDSWGKLPWLSKAFMGWTNIKYALEDHSLLDKEIRQSKMDWSLVRAVRLEFDDPNKQNDPKTDITTLGSAGDGMGVSDSVTVTSVAKFLVKVAVEGRFIKEAVVVRN